MFRIKDKVLLGALSAVLTTIILNIIDWISVLLKLNKWHIWQIAASLYFNSKDLDTIPALFIGAMTHTSIMALAGVVSLDALKAANPQIANPDMIFPGQAVCVPGVTPPVPCQGGNLYTVRSGDTMFDIATRFGLTLQALIAAPIHR